MRKLTGAINKSNTIIVFINQLRMKIGVMFGSPETTTGGNALKFYCLSVRHPSNWFHQEGRFCPRNRTRGKWSKIKLPLHSVKLSLISSWKRNSKVGEVIDLATETKLFRELALGIPMERPVSDKAETMRSSSWKIIHTKRLKIKSAPSTNS